MRGSFSFSHNIIQEYKLEISNAFGVFVDDAEAQIQLRALARSMFPTVIAVENAESRERTQGKAQTACGRSLSATMAADGGNEVGGSITPTSGHKDKAYE